MQLSGVLFSREVMSVSGSNQYCTGTADSISSLCTGYGISFDRTQSVYRIRYILRPNAVCVQDTVYPSAERTTGYGIFSGKMHFVYRIRYILMPNEFCVQDTVPVYPTAKRSLCTGYGLSFGRTQFCQDPGRPNAFCVQDTVYPPTKRSLLADFIRVVIILASKRKSP